METESNKISKPDKSSLLYQGFDILENAFQTFFEYGKLKDGMNPLEISDKVKQLFTEYKVPQVEIFEFSRTLTSIIMGQIARGLNEPEPEITETISLSSSTETESVSSLTETITLSN